MVVGDAMMVHRGSGICKGYAVGTCSRARSCGSWWSHDGIF